MKQRKVRGRLCERVLDRLDRTGANRLAGRLRRERHRLLREGIDALTRLGGGSLHDAELRKTGQSEDAVLLQLAMPNGNERLEHALHLLTAELLTRRLGDGLNQAALAHRP